MNKYEKLKAIQDIKSEKYVGTQDALNYINRMKALRENPSKIAHSINHRIRQTLDTPNPDYEATPENVLGLSEFLSNQNYEIIIENCQWDQRDLARKLSTVFISSPEIITGNKNVCKIENYNVGDLVNGLTPIFLDAQVKGANNYTLGASAAGKFVRNFKGVDGEIIKSAQKLMLQNYISINWDEALSRDKFSELEKKLKKIIIFEELNLGRRIERIRNAKAEKNPKYRREILTDWLAEINCDSYGQAEKTLQFFISGGKSNLGSCIKNNLPAPMIESTRSYLKNNEFILNILQSDKNFVKKYLSS